MALDDSKFRYIGKPQIRTEDDRLLRGRGAFSDDFIAPDMLYAAVVRSPHAHARIASIDTTCASRMPGVHCILDGADAAADGLGFIDHNPLPKTRYDMKLEAAHGDFFFGPHVVLPADKVRHVGEAVAFVVADSRQLAEDAAEQVEVAYEVLTPVLEHDAAISGAGPDPVWDERPDNVFIDSRFGDAEQTALAFSRAHAVVEAQYCIQRVTGVPLEPRAALGQFDPATGRYTLHAGSGGAVKQRREIAGVLGVDESDVRVLSHDVGGNFGTRNRTYVEFILTLWASRKIGRPVKFTASRSESFLSDYQGRDFISKAALALDETGRILAMRADNLSNAGSRCVSLSPLGKGSALITGSYDVPVASLRARAFFSNTVPTQAYRSSGRPEATFVIERLVDLAAAKLQIDPLELRRRNLIPANAMPYTNAVGARYDSGDYAHAMELAQRTSDWSGYESRVHETERRGLVRGRGFANYVESSIGAPRERAEITASSDGSVVVVIGTQPSGQGHETSFAQVAADLLEIEFDAVRIIYTDTDIVTIGGGSHSGRSMRHAGVVIGHAATQLLDKARALAADCLEVAADTLEYGRGRFVVPGTDLAVSLQDAVATTVNSQLVVEYINEMHDPVFPNGAAVCEVEIDPETGECTIDRYTCVDDVGRCINPLIVHGQAHGAIVQGVGQAMGEAVVVSAPDGQVLTGSLMDYRLPRAADFPMFDTEIIENLSPTNPLGIKAGGEGGTTPALAVYVAAVVDALRPWGVDHLELPVTGPAILSAIHGRTDSH